MTNSRFPDRLLNDLTMNESLSQNRAVLHEHNHPLFVFLDRDGTIIEEKDYLDSVEGMVFIPGSEAAIARLNQAGFKVVVISNQSGIARGYFPESVVHDIHNAMQEHLQQHGARIDAFYYCPHHPDDGCACRKPKTAMLEWAARDMKLALRGALVGDRVSDLGAARAAGLVSILVRTGYGENTLAESEVDADFIATDLTEAAEWLLSSNSYPMRTIRDQTGKDG